MTGYPGDEHVFCVVGIVLARSPDCNPSNSGFLRPYSRVLCVCSTCLCVPPSVILCDLCGVSCVRVPCCFESERIRQFNIQPTTDEVTRQPLGKTAIFTSGFGAKVEGSKSGHWTSCNRSSGRNEYNNERRKCEKRAAA